MPCHRGVELVTIAAVTGTDRGDGCAAAPEQGQPGDRAEHPGGLAARPHLTEIHALLREVANT
jgi:hypothetical protein